MAEGVGDEVPNRLLQQLAVASEGDPGRRLDAQIDLCVARSWQEAATELVAGTFVVETDSPYLGPEAGGRNEPTTAVRVASELARLRGVDPAELVAPIRSAYDRALAG